MPANIAVLLLLIGLFYSCSKSDQVTTPPPNNTPVDSIPSIDTLPTPPVQTALDTLASGWSRVFLPDLGITDIDFVDTLKGYIITHKGVYISADGGRAWRAACNGCTGIG